MRISPKRRIILVVLVALLLQTVSLQSPLVSAAVKDTKQDAARAYLQVITNLIRDKGISLEDISSIETEGVSYAELIDFDLNGIPELYLIYKTHSDETYTQEIWDYNIGKANKVFKETYSGLGLSEDRSVSITRGKSASYLNYTSGHSSGGGADVSAESLTTDRFFTLVNHKFVPISNVSETFTEYLDGSKKIEYEKNADFDANSKSTYISKDQYLQILSNYGYKNRKEIVNGGAGSPGYSFNYKNNLTTVMNFILTLKNTSRTIGYKNLYPAMKGTDKSKLISFLHKFSGLTKNVDVSKMKDSEVVTFIYDALQYDQTSIINEKELTPNISAKIPTTYISTGDSDPDLIYTYKPYADKSPVTYMTNQSKQEVIYTYKAYSKQQFDAFTQKIFGKTIKPIDYFDKANYEQLRYKDGYYYLKYFYDKVYTIRPQSPQVDTLFSLGNGLYYAEFNSFYFADDWYTYNKRKYLTPIAAWDEEDKNNVSGYETGYALLKETTIKGVTSWQLIKYSENERLTDKELSSLLKK